MVSLVLEVVVSHEIIDMEENMEEDSGDIADEVPKTNSKGKELLQEFSDGDDASENDDEFMDDNSNLSDEEDEWAEQYHDEMLFDEYSAWESKFDHMEVPTGIEVRFPWFPVPSGNEANATETSSSTPQPDAENSSSANGNPQPSNKAFSYLKPEKQSSNSPGKNKRSYNSMNSLHLSNGGGSSVSSDVETAAIGAGPTSPEPRKMEEILENYGSFKRFETVEDFSDHHYREKGYSSNKPPKNWAKKIMEEWRVLEKDLPDKIFVRAYESRMDLLRAVIIGAEGTPYHDGLFFFDLYFPSSYPTVPPLVYYHSGGLRINPNLYNCGKVCLSLLNTWSGSQKEKWIPGESTMLQVLVSIQGLILNAEPFFNEPGYADSRGSSCGELRSLEYNESTFMYSLQTMVYKIRNPPKYFEDFVVGHFVRFGRDILMACKAYLDGARVGSVVKGVVKEGKEGKGHKSSEHFKANLVGFLSVAVPTFLQIGAKDCEEFIGLALRGNGIDGITKPAAHSRGSTELYG